MLLTADLRGVLCSVMHGEGFLHEMTGSNALDKFTLHYQPCKNVVSSVSLTPSQHLRSTKLSG